MDYEDYLRSLTDKEKKIYSFIRELTAKTLEVPAEELQEALGRATRAFPCDVSTNDLLELGDVIRRELSQRRYVTRMEIDIEFGARSKTGKGRIIDEAKQKDIERLLKSLIRKKVLVVELGYKSAYYRLSDIYSLTDDEITYLSRALWDEDGRDFPYVIKPSSDLYEFMSRKHFSDVAQVVDYLRTATCVLERLASGGIKALSLGEDSSKDERFGDALRFLITGGFVESDATLTGKGRGWLATSQVSGMPSFSHT